MKRLGPARTTVALAALLAVLGAGYYFHEVRGHAVREAARAAERRVMDFDPGAVRELTIEQRGERVVVRGDGGRWRIVAPEEGPADGPTVDGLLAFVRRLEKERVLDGAADLSAFGLADPLVRLRLELHGGQTVTLRLAGPNPAGTGVYAAVEGSPVVFLAPSELARELAKRPYVAELRDRTLLPVDVERVRRLEIARAGVRIEVSRLEPHRWHLERPFAGPGDDGIIRDLLWKIGAARSRSTLPATAPAPGLDRPHARVRIVDDRGTARTLTVTLDEAGRRLYAAVDGAPAVHVTDAQLLSDLALDPDALRDRQLLVLRAGDVERITIRYPTATLVLERTGDDAWRVRQPSEGEAARLVVENLLEILPNVRYRAIAAPEAGALERWGLDRPRYAVAVGLRDGRTLPALSVGAEDGGEHFVMVAGQPAVYRVDSKLIRVIPDDPAEAKRYPLPEQLKRGLDKQQVAR